MVDITAYPHLFHTVRWGRVSAQFSLNNARPDLMAQVTVIPFVEAETVVLTPENRLPGDILQPDEDYIRAAARIMRSQTHAAPTGAFRLFGVWMCYSSAVKPEQPHMPHPYFVHGVGWMIVPPVAQAHPLEDVVQRFYEDERPELADVLHLAAAMLQKF